MNNNKIAVNTIRMNPAVHQERAHWPRKDLYRLTSSRYRAEILTLLQFMQSSAKLQRRWLVDSRFSFIKPQRGQTAGKITRLYYRFVVHYLAVCGGRHANWVQSKRFRVRKRTTTTEPFIHGRLACVNEEACHASSRRPGTSRKHIAQRWPMPSIRHSWLLTLVNR